MGQTQSHKHMRNEYLKNTNYNPQINLNNQTSVNSSDYQNDENIDDEEITGANVNLNNSYHSSYVRFLKIFFK